MGIKVEVARRGTPLRERVGHRFALSTWPRVAACLGTIVSIGVVSSRPASGESVSTQNSVAVGGIARIPTNARPLGGMPPSDRITIGLSLSPRDAGGMAEYASEVSEPGSPYFHEYVTPKAFAATYGASAKSVAAVKTWLHSTGVSVGKLAENGLLLPFSGTVGEVSSMLQTHISQYLLGDDQIGWAANTEPLVPAQIAASIQGIIGLNNLSTPHALGLSPARVPSAIADVSNKAGTKRVSAAPSACVVAKEAAVEGRGWTDDEVAKAYGLNGLFARGDEGSGQTIALYELEPFLATDLATFDKCYFGKSHTKLVTRVPLDGFSLSGAGSGEAILDLEELSALAPKAHILVYAAPNTTFGALNEYNTIISQDQANVISTSWGECESSLEISAPGAQQVENSLFEEAAMQGQTFVAATGDAGSDDCASTPFGSSKPAGPYLSVDDPASQPFVLAVGGSSLNSDHPPLSGTSETVWNDGPEGGGAGGGMSSTWPSPTWQSQSGIPGVLPTGNRQVPDVVASADEEHGITVYSSSFGGPVSENGSSAEPSTNGWTTLGGTSSAAPVWASIIVDIAASPGACSTLPSTAGGADLGFVSPELYSAANFDYTQSFHNVVSGSNDVFALSLGYSASPGFNLASGLGSPIVTAAGGTGGLAAALCAVATNTVPTAPSRPTISSIAPTFGSTAGGTTVTILGTNFPSLSALRVDVGGSPARIVSETSTSIFATVPAPVLSAGSASFAAAGPAAVTVTSLSPLGFSTSAPALFNYVNENSNNSVLPTVTGMAPFGGAAAGGGTVTLFGSGFSSGTPQVTVGGVPASNVVVKSDFQLTFAAPREIAATNCAQGSGFAPASTCQTAVVVTNANGSSPLQPVLPALSGPVVFTKSGVVEPLPGTEVAPASTEYDYSPVPRITSIASNRAMGGYMHVTIDGQGFSIATLAWVNFGPARSFASEQLRVTNISPTAIQIAVPVDFVGDRAHPLRGGVSVQTDAGLSNVVPFRYPGKPSVRRLSSYGGDTNGGSLLTVTGTNLNRTTHVAFENAGAPKLLGASVVPVVGTPSNTSFRVLVPKHRAGIIDVVPCTASGCAKPAQFREAYDYYNPARPVNLTGSRSGSASGGSTVTILGKDATFARSLKFGTTSVRVRHDAHYPKGDGFVADATVPPGLAGTTVRLVLKFKGGMKRSVALGHFSFTKELLKTP